MISYIAMNFAADMIEGLSLSIQLSFRKYNHIQLKASSPSLHPGLTHVRRLPLGLGT